MGETKFDIVFRDDDNNEADARPGSEGFSANMSGLNMYDFVQMECLAGARRAIRVTSGHHIGYLFFSDGEVTHALTPDAHGEAAALQILGWRHGCLEQCALHPNEHSRIHRPWQQLLLRAAQVEDESKRDNLVAFPRKKAEQRSTLPPSNPSANVAGAGESRHSLPSVNRDGVLGAARVNASGEVLSARGESGDLPGLAAYALRLAELIGLSMGIEQVKTIDARCGRTRSAVKKEASGAIVIVRALTQETHASDGPEARHESITQDGLSELLAGLRDVDGVLGSFLLGKSGTPMALDLPKVFGAEVVQEVGTRLVRLREALESQGDGLRSLEIRYNQQRLYVRVCQSSLLGVLILGTPNMALLGMAAAVIGRRAAGLEADVQPLTQRSNELAASVPAVRGSYRPEPEASRRVLAAPGAPSAGGPRSKRPVYFRGRRIQ